MNDTEPDSCPTCSQTKKLERLQAERLCKERENPGDLGSVGPAFIALLVPRKSLETDLNVDIEEFLSEWNSRNDGPGQNLSFEDGLAARMFWNFDGLLLRWARREVQFFHSGAVEFVLRLDIRDGYIRNFWTDVDRLIRRFAPVLESLSQEPAFYLACGLIGTDGLEFQADGAKRHLRQPTYPFPTVYIEGLGGLRPQLQSLKLRVGHTLGENWT